MLLIITLIKCSYSQYRLKDMYSSDTIEYKIIGENLRYSNSDSTHSHQAILYKFFRSHKVELGVSYYYYNVKTSEWLEQVIGPNFNYELGLGNLNFGLRYKPVTVNPKKELTFCNVVLPDSALLNSIKIDYYVGYSFNFRRSISIEPYIGYNRSSFYVINENKLNQKYFIPTAEGLTAGLTFNKYIKLKKEHRFISLYGRVGYSFVNFNYVHKELDNGYFEWSFGIALKRLFQYSEIVNK